MDLRIGNLAQPVWNQQAPANTNTPVQSFASVMEETTKTGIHGKPGISKEEIIRNLSPSSQAVLQNIKTHQPTVRKEEWINMLCELREMGAITPEECLLSWPGMTLIPFVSHDGGKTYQAARIPEEIQHEMEDNMSWPCDPLEQLDTQVFLLKKWFQYLTAEMERCEEPLYNCLEPVRGQADACSRVSSLVKSLIS